MTKRFRVPFLFILLVCLSFPFGTHGSGPDISGLSFAFIRHPENARISTYARGDIELPQPEYHRTYLFAAYRYLSGKGFSPAEQTALAELWNDKFGFDGRQFSDDGVAPAVNRWLDARTKVPGAGGVTYIDRTSYGPKQGYDAFLNCPDDAFLTAAATLEDRIAKYGAESAAVRDWLEAQDIVFGNCSGGGAIPDPAPAGANPLAAADRAYQIAAANFYAGRYDEAEKQFRAVASDAASPWRVYAPYLVARTLIRRACFADNPEALHKQAEAQLRAVIADPSRRKLHASALGLIELIRQRTASPDARLRDLAPRLANGDESPTLAATLWDYKLSLDWFLGEWYFENGPQPDPAMLTEIRRTDDMTDWILTFQEKTDAARAHAVEKWKGTKSTPWLIAALVKSDGTSPDAAALIDAAAKVPVTSPGYTAATFEAVRVTIDLGRHDEARRTLDALLAKKSSSVTFVNLLRGQRLRVARSLDEFLAFATRTPIGRTYFQIPFEGPVLDPPDGVADDRLPRFDLDAKLVFNQRMPVSLLLQAGRAKTLPTHLRRMLALAALTRALLLDDEGRVLEAIPLVKSLAPEMRNEVDAYAAATGRERKLAGLFLLLRFPGLRIDADERTCGFTSGTPLGSITGTGDGYWNTAGLTLKPGERADPDVEDEDFSPRRTPIDAGGFLTAEQRAMAKREVTKLLALDAPATYLCKRAVEWARQSPNDPRVPEALARAVRASRWGYGDDRTGTWSKAAFQILHRRYPNSEWTRRTPYWYG